MAASCGHSLLRRQVLMRGGDRAALTHIRPFRLGPFRHEYSTPAGQPWVPFCCALQTSHPTPPPLRASCHGRWADRRGCSPRFESLDDNHPLAANLQEGLSSDLLIMCRPIK